MSSESNNPKTNASQFIDNIIARYQSTEQKRIAVRKALSSRPDDQQLLQTQTDLSSADRIYEAVEQGVFISYTRSDELYAIELTDKLTANKVNIWLDMLNVQSDADWYDEVDSAMENCGLMIAVISRDSINDETAIFERQNFDLSGKLILPAMFHRCDTSPYDLHWLTPIDFTRDFQLGLHNLLRVLGIEPAGV
jgi:hypothetical protein